MNSDMNVTQMIQVLAAASEALQEAGNSRHAAGVQSFAALFEGHGNKTILAFTNQLNSALKGMGTANAHLRRAQNDV
jgi:hypothetical protein